MHDNTQNDQEQGEEEHTVIACPSGEKAHKQKDGTGEHQRHSSMLL